MSGVLGEMVAAEVPAGLGKYRKFVGAVNGVLGEMVAADEVPAGLGKYRKVGSEWKVGIIYKVTVRVPTECNK